jgi:glutathione S-transferase
MKNSKIKLYYMPGACSLADLIVLEWTRTPYEAVRMHHATLKSPQYLAKNPSGAVPLLEHGDWSVTENVAILGYLADLHPEAQLFGDGTARGRAEVMRWLGYLNSDVHKAFGPIFTPQRYLAAPELSDQLAQSARTRVRGQLALLDQRLSDRDWLTGQRSVADPYLFVITRWAVSKQVGLEAFANLSRFAERMNDDAGVRAALAVEASDNDITPRLRPRLALHVDAR